MTENAKTRQNAYFEMANNGEGEGGILEYVPFLAPKAILAGPNWHIAHLDHVSYKIRLQLGL